jgi:outer membrane protein assembly factor BamE (lipoprotein component of BamABCDE complex)
MRQVGEMTNERMTNDEGRANAGNASHRVTSFGLRHSFVIRHSTFVILLAFILALAACNSSKRLTKANVDEVAEGMAKKQVESILGPPTTIDTKDFALLKKTTYVYDQGKDSVTIVFKDDKVQSKVSTLTE